jgi:hypothetical protein
VARVVATAAFVLAKLTGKAAGSMPGISGSRQTVRETRVGSAGPGWVIASMARAYAVSS